MIEQNDRHMVALEGGTSNRLMKRRGDAKRIKHYAQQETRMPNKPANAGYSSSVERCRVKVNKLKISQDLRR